MNYEFARTLIPSNPILPNFPMWLNRKNHKKILQLSFCFIKLCMIIRFQSKITLKK